MSARATLDTDQRERSAHRSDLGYMFVEEVHSTQYLVDEEKYDTSLVIKMRK